MNNIWKFPCWPTRNNYIQRKVATPLASSQLHRGNREEDFPPECYAYHALLVFYVSTYICFRLLLYFQKNKKEWRIYEEVMFSFFDSSLYFSLSSSFWRHGSFVFEFHLSQEHFSFFHTTIEMIREKLNHLHFNFYARDSYFLQVSSLLYMYFPIRT